MANNRLFIFDPQTKRGVMLAKSMGSGWYPHERVTDALERFFKATEDLGATEWADHSSTTRFELRTETDLPGDADIIWENRDAPAA